MWLSLMYCKIYDTILHTYINTHSGRYIRTVRTYVPYLRYLLASRKQLETPYRVMSRPLNQTHGDKIQHPEKELTRNVSSAPAWQTDILQDER